MIEQMPTWTTPNTTPQPESSTDILAARYADHPDYGGFDASIVNLIQGEQTYSIELPDFIKPAGEVEPRINTSMAEKFGAATFDAVSMTESEVVDGEEVDLNASTFSLEDRRAMREGARFRSAAELAQAPLTQDSLRAAMGAEPLPPQKPVIEDLEGMMAGEVVAPKSWQELSKDLSDDDKMELRSYAGSRQDRQDVYAASRRGDHVNPQDSQIFAQQMAASIRAMSTAARGIADKYADSFNES